MSEIVFAHSLCGESDKAKRLALACLVMTGKVDINNLHVQLHINPMQPCYGCIVALLLHTAQKMHTSACL